MPRILHLCRRPLNGHPAWLAELQRRQGWDAKVCAMTARETGKRPYPTDIKHTDRSGLKQFAQSSTVLHLHDDLTLQDTYAKDVYAMIPEGAIVVHQYYHERSSIPSALRHSPGRDEFPCILAKKAALIDPLPRLPLVIPHWRPELKPDIKRRDKLRLVFTPTSTQRMLSYLGTRGKGYGETKAILDRFVRWLDVEIITNLDWRSTMASCQNADIRLDEVMTGSYGQCSLEGLALGCITVTGMNDAVEALLPASFPGFRATDQSLEAVLHRIVQLPWNDRKALMEAGPEWMAANYSEAWLHGQYEAFYQRCFQSFTGDTSALKATAPERRIAVQIVQIVQPVMIAATQPVIADKPSGKLIVQISKTNCAGAIWRLHDAINRYTPHTCRTITFSTHTNGRAYPKDVLISEPAVGDLLKRADVIHFHNYVDPYTSELMPFRDAMRGKKMVLQYHTEPQFLRGVFSNDVVSRTDLPTLVIAQKHPRFYPNSLVVPNIVPIDHENLRPSDRRWTPGTPLKVIYTPSDLKSYPDYTGTCCGKGYPEMMPVLQRLEKEGVIALTVITDSTWEALMPIKRIHDICIDELVTGGYHLCSLEALSQGLITMAWLDDKTQKAVEAVVGKKTRLPWVNTPLAALESTLRSLAAKTADEIQALKSAGRRWMEKYWHPATLVKRFLSVYGITNTTQVVHHFPTNLYLPPVYNATASIGTDLEALQGAWRDQQVVIWGNGPTALDAVASKKWDPDAKHIGTNAATKLRDHFDAYCIGDSRFAQVPEKLEIARTASGVRCYLAHLRAVMPRVEANYVRCIGNDGFSSDVTAGFFHGFSVVWVALQLAAYAGAAEVLLAGCGHQYLGKPRFYSEVTPSPIDANTDRILANYRRLPYLLRELGMVVKTIGPSRLNEAGIPQLVGR